MISPELETALEASWPAAKYAMAGTFHAGCAQDGGMRVNSARPVTPNWIEDDIQQVEAIQARWNQPPTIQVSADDRRLAELLNASGWQARTPTLIMSAPVTALTDRQVPPVTSFALWPPLAIQRELWAELGIGPARQAIIERVSLPKAAILGRVDDRAAGVAFIAACDKLAVLHALEIVPNLRRKGLAGWIIRKAAFWAGTHGCKALCLAVTRDNSPAITLYRGLGFTETGGYSYYMR
ncbi:MAG: GNAT family N-acetyltransferase [Paracoccus sp. (in: a-proteobacteria)]